MRAQEKKKRLCTRIAPGMLFFLPVWFLEHLSCEKSLGDLGLFNLEERWFQRDATAAPSDYGNVIEETKPSSSQWCVEENKEVC